MGEAALKQAWIPTISRDEFENRGESPAQHNKKAFITLRGLTILNLEINNGERT